MEIRSECVTEKCVVHFLIVIIILCALRYYVTDWIIIMYSRDSRFIYFRNNVSRYVDNKINITV